MSYEISTSIHSQILDEIFQIKSFVESTCGGHDANGGDRTTSLFLSEGRSNGTSDHFQAPFDDLPWNEIKLNRLYESTCVGFMKVPVGFPKFP